MYVCVCVCVSVWRVRVIDIVFFVHFATELIGEEIVDETDEYEDVTKKNKRVALASVHSVQLHPVFFPLPDFLTILPPHQ